MRVVETTDVVVIGTGFGGAIPAYNLAAGGAKVVMLERGPEMAAKDFTHSLELGTYTRYVDLINGDGVQVVAGNCVGGSSVVYFAASLRAPSFVFDRKGSPGRGRLWPPPLTPAGPDPRYDPVEGTIPGARPTRDARPHAPPPPRARPLVRPRRGDDPGRAADLGRRALRGRRVGGRLPQRRAHLQPGAAGGRPPDLHQLQLDALGLPVRCQALDAAELPAGGPGARRRDPAAARGPARRTGDHTGLPLPGRLHRRRPVGLPADPGRRVDRGEGCDHGRGRDGHARDPPALVRGARRGAGGRRPVLLPQRRPRLDGAARRGEAHLRAGPAAGTRSRVRGVPHRQADRLDELRLP